MMKKSADVVRRWVNEVQEAVNSDNQMVQVKNYIYWLICGLT